MNTKVVGNLVRREFIEQCSDEYCILYPTEVDNNFTNMLKVADLLEDQGGIAAFIHDPVTDTLHVIDENTIKGI